MKKTLLILILLISFATMVDAQYKINKTKYNFRSYSYEVGDPYNPGVAGLCSFLIPGLGQMLSGETGRGVGFLASEIGFGIIYFSGVSKAVNTYDYNVYSNTETASGGGQILIGAAGMIAVNIWAIVDAVRVAKVNNLAWRDSRGTFYNLKIDPYFGNNQYAATGLSLKLKF